MKKRNTILRSILVLLMVIAILPFAALRANAVTVAVDPEGAGTAARTYNPDDTVTVTATPAGNYAFVNWTEDGSVVEDSDGDPVGATYTFAITDNTVDRTLVTNFGNEYTITATANIEDGGTVTGGGSYAYGTTVTLEAAPKAGYVFDYWTVDANPERISSRILEVTVEGPRKYTAWFWKVKIEDVDSAYEYTGGQIKPKPSVYLGDVTKDEPVWHSMKDYDYKLSYGDNVHAGDGAGSVKVTFTEASGFIGEATKTFDITRRPLIVTAGSEARAYDGEALTAGYSSGELAAGDEITSIEVGGSQTDVGKSESKVDPKSVVIRNSEYGDATGDYDITCVPGELEVTPYTGKVTVTVKGHTASFTYDGGEHEASGYDVTADVPFYGTSDIGFSGTASVKATNAGVYTMGLEPGDFSNKSANFTNVFFVVEDGTLTVKPAQLTLTVTGFNGQFDAQPHTVSAIPSVVDDTTVQYSIDGENWGLSAPNRTDICNLTVYVKASKRNYNDATASTELIITRAPATVTANSASKVFGTADPTFSAIVTGIFANEDFTLEYSVTRPGKGTDEDAGTYPDAVVPVGEKEQGNYTVTYAAAAFIITKAGAPTLTDTNKPSANDLTENGSDQALVTAPETVPDGYTVEYSTDGENWSDEIPTGKESCEYAVQVRYTGDADHESFDGETVNVKIKAVYTIIWLDAEGNELDKKTYVEGEDVPTTDKEPTKAEDADSTYTFEKWDDGTVDGKTTTCKPVFTTVPKPVYTVSGDLTDYTLGTSEDVIITVNREPDDDKCFDYFSGVELDGTALVSGTDYTAAKGSTVVTVHAAVLEALAEGEHTVKVLFDDGEAKAEFTVNEPVPVTGDGGTAVIWAALLAVSGMALAIAFGKKRRVVR